MSWNLWFGGDRVDDSLDKQLTVIGAFDPDVLLLQECYGGAAQRLAEALSMRVARVGEDTAVLARLPLEPVAADTESFASAAVVDVAGTPVLVWSVHLEHTDYGPYRHELLPDRAGEVFAQSGEALRTAQAHRVLAETERILADQGFSAVVIGGDFNVPSPADWNGAGRPQVRWPATAQMLDAGFVDAFRSVHPDPGAAPGETWSPIEVDAEPRDRIDFLFARGLAVVSAEHALGEVETRPMVGAGVVRHPGPARQIPDQRGNAFPSDHAAVRAVFRLAH